MTCYDPFAATFSRSRTGMQWPELDEIIANIRNNQIDALLDIGCGNGRFLEAWYAQHPHSANRSYIHSLSYIGIDQSASLIQEAQKRYPQHAFFRGDMRYVDRWRAQVPGNISHMIMIASWHHLESEGDRLNTLKWLRSLLQKWWYLFMTNWNLRDQPRYHRCHQWENVYHIKIGEHIRYYYAFTLDEIARLAHEAGYVVCENRIFTGGRNLYTILQNPR